MGFRFSVEAPDQTESVGEAWGRAARPGDVLLLVGELGMGKTTLVRGLARGLGVEFGVKSPTFAIQLTYPGRLTVHHLDLYRVTDPRDLDELGLDDLFGREGVTVVEWGDRLGDLAPAWAVTAILTDLSATNGQVEVYGPEGSVTFIDMPPTTRRVEIYGPSEPVNRWYEALSAPPGTPWPEETPR